MSLNVSWMNPVCSRAEKHCFGLLLRLHRFQDPSPPPPRPPPICSPTEQCSTPPPGQGRPDWGRLGASSPALVLPWAGWLHWRCSGYHGSGEWAGVRLSLTRYTTRRGTEVSPGEPGDTSKLFLAEIFICLAENNFLIAEEATRGSPPARKGGSRGSGIPGKLIPPDQDVSASPGILTA